MRECHSNPEHSPRQTHEHPPPHQDRPLRPGAPTAIINRVLNDMPTAHVGAVQWRRVGPRKHGTTARFQQLQGRRYGGDRHAVAAPTPPSAVGKTAAAAGRPSRTGERVGGHKPGGASPAVSPRTTPDGDAV